jgi:hypothetical protein
MVEIRSDDIGAISRPLREREATHSLVYDALVLAD